MRLNPDPNQRRVGIFFMILWTLLLLFYLTWNGWLYEWRDCGYAGPNEHFSLKFEPMKWGLDHEGKVVYHTLKNYHNILYLCYLQFLFGWLGLLFNNKSLKQGSVALFPLTVASIASTVFPLKDHMYCLQWAYDTLHLSGVFLGGYILTTEKMDIKAGLPYIFGSWGVFYLSKILCCKWPFWKHPNGYFSLNQINNMPFSFYGLEYLVTITILVIFAFATYWLQRLAGKRRILGALLPVIAYLLTCFILLAVGVIKLQTLHTGTCR